MTFLRTALVGLLSLSSVPVVAAQVEHGGRPPSLRRELRLPRPTARMRPVDGRALLAEDELTAARREKLPRRFAEVLEVELGLTNAGVWEELGRGDRVWRLRIESPGARSLAFVFRRFQLPVGGELYVYDDRRETVRGAYTEHENRLDGEFAIQPTRGEALTLEYFEPARARGRGELVLGLVVHDYCGVLEDKSGSGASGACNIDVACPAGAGWEDQVSGVVKILALPHGAICSGSLINNTAGDGTLLVLTAAHCGFMNNAVFTFNYERPSCGAGAAPQTDTLVGAVELVVDSALDYRLVRLLDPAPASFGVYLSGWDRSDATPASSMGIHHPGGDAKKLSRDDDPPLVVGPSWQVVRWDLGVTEGGSSGSPLFDPDRRIIGQLDRGNVSCLFPNGTDYYGRLGAQWERMGPYLDPLATGQLVLDGLDPAGLTPLPFDVRAVAPAQVDTLTPGTNKVVRILGDGFSDASTVALDGVPLPPESFVRGGNTWINVDTPPLDAGPHEFSVTEGAETKSILFDVVPPSRPVLQVDTGDQDAQLVSVAGVDVLHADQPGHVHYCYYSISGLPSVHPLLTLGLGNQFTQLIGCRIQPIPAQGWLGVHHDIPSGAFPPSTTVYAQSACISHGRPFATSSLQRSIVVF